jgi:hypothetical protein
MITMPAENKPKESAPAKDAQREENQSPGVIAEKQSEGSVNKESNKFKDADGAVIDATPEGSAASSVQPTEEKAPLNPYTKAYKADFPSRVEASQNAVATDRDAQK